MHGGDRMNKPILFSLEKCTKCYQTKQLLSGKDNIEIVTFPHDYTVWSEENIHLAKSYDIFEDLQVTAPILWVDGEKIIGYLRIRKWLQDNKL
jgi:glutaredoxin